MPGGGLTLFRVRGIRISVDYSWFIVPDHLRLSKCSYRDVLGAGEDDFGPYALAVASALFFASILLHELGHAYVAIRHGIGISRTCGCSAGWHSWRGLDSPSTEFKIAIGGPIVTALIVLLCAGALLLAGTDEFREAALTTGDADTTGLAALIAWLGSINLLVLIFNLSPHPGRRPGIAWWRTGSRTSRTRFAATLGQGFGLFLILVGLVLHGVPGGPRRWHLARVPGIPRRGAGAIAQTELTSRIEGVSVADVDPEPVAIPEELSVERALDEYFLRLSLALVPWSSTRRSTSSGCSTADRRRGADAGAGLVHGQRRVRPSTAARCPFARRREAILSNESLRRLGALVATDGDGRIRGVLTIDAIGRALRPGPPARLHVTGLGHGPPL